MNKIVVDSSIEFFYYTDKKFFDRFKTILRLKSSADSTFFFDPIKNVFQDIK